jgi:hypothetical protein
MVEELCARVIEGLSKSVRTIIAEQLSCFGAEMAELRASLSAVYQDCDSIKARVAHLEKVEEENILLKNRLSELELRNREFADKIDDLAATSGEREQYFRKNNLEIVGVPETTGESLKDIIYKIASKLGVTLCDTDYTRIHRVASWTTQKMPAKILIHLINQEKVEEFLTAARRKKGLLAREIDFQSDSRIFLNYHLTPANKILYRKVKDLARAKEYQYVWIKRCIIYVRKSDKSHAIVVKSSSHLSKII